MITFLTLKKIAQKTKLYVKKYWKLILGAVVLCFVYFTSRAKVHSMAKTLKIINDSHKKEINAIEKAHQAEVKKIEKAKETLKSTMQEVESKYAEAEQKLNSKKKKQVEKIIKENHDDPDAITEKIAKLTGFNVHVK